MQRLKAASLGDSRVLLEGGESVGSLVGTSPAGVEKALWHLAVLALLLLPSVAQALEPSGYANVVIGEATNDPYLIGPELRRQAQELGFSVYSTGAQIPQEEWPKTCYAIWSWRAGSLGGSIQFTLHDALTGKVIRQGRGKATNWVGVGKAVRVGVRKLWASIGYRGFSQAAHERNVATLFPERPRLDIDEQAVRSASLSSRVEGIWTDPDNVYRIGIVGDPGQQHGYVGVILESRHPLWSPGEVKLELNPTAAADTFIGNYYPANKKRQGSTFRLEGGLLRFEMADPAGNKAEQTLVKAWPELAAPGPRAAPSVASKGSGFFVGGSKLVATNWHVVEGASRIEVSVPGETASHVAEVAIRDTVNDLAILRVGQEGATSSDCEPPPYSLVSAATLSLGERVSVIGFPLSGLLGSEPRYSQGVVSSKTGLQDDPRTIQISAEIQPGSSGSPLLDEEGNVVGIVVSTLNASYLYSQLEALPQNVNFAVKADYLLNLLRMLPEGYSPEPRTGNTPEEIARCVVEIIASR